MLRPASPSDPRELVVVVGAGLAGAACAAAIARRGRRVLLLEAESLPGTHSSGRNAGLLRQAVEDPVTARLTREGAAAIRARSLGSETPRGVAGDLPGDSPAIGVLPTGSVLVDPSARIPAAVWSAIEHRPVDPDELVARMPWLDGAALDGAVETPDDAIVDVHALLSSLLHELRAHGGEVRLDSRVHRPRVVDGAVVGVRTAREFIATSEVVVATGAWAGAWGERCGVPIALTPTRRSLVLTALPFPVPDVPWVWHVDAGWYLRPESGGMLWCAGEEHPDSAGDAAADPSAIERLATVVDHHLPAVTGWSPRRHWAGHRSFLPDRRFLLGPDPRCAGWHWAVGLGGHGMTTCLAVGERVARALVDEDPSAIEPELRIRPAVLSGALVAGGEPLPFDDVGTCGVATSSRRPR